MNRLRWFWPRPAIRELLLALLLAFGLLAFGLWQQLASMRGLTSNWGALAELLGLRLGGTPLGVAVLRYAVALLALHAALAIVVWFAATLTRHGFAISDARRRYLVPAWFLAVVIWLLVANATLFPWSKSGVPSELIGMPIIGSARILEFLSIFMLGALLSAMALATRRAGWWRALSRRTLVYSSVGVVILAVFGFVSAMREAPPQSAGGRPNIILIGVDSLRTDVVGAGRGPGITPNIDAFVRDGAQLFTDAVTPLARTFPAWVSILSGRYPSATGARENLIATSAMKPFESVAQIARRNGYHSIYATDEVRFSNIDQGYGFDTVITPTIGAADFLLGKFNDFPLTNLVANTWLGKWLFPATYANRAATVTYQPETFVRWLDAGIQPGRPTFLAVHLALPHHPYNWSEPGDQIFGRASDNAYQYSNAVIAADRQFGAIIQALERKGMLQDALVVVLSDHGEALGLPDSDTLLRGAVAREMLDGQRISLWGHGSSVLSPHQYSTFLALRGFGAVNLPPAYREHGEPVSLVDLAPTIVDLLALQTDAKFDGLSLAPAIAGNAEAIAAVSRRLRFTETGLRTDKLEHGDFNETSVLGDTAKFFLMNPVSSRLELRPEMLPYLLADKERAVMSSDWILAAIPSRNHREQHKYVLVSRHGEPPQRIESAPADDGSELSRLWREMHAHYGAELLPPAPRQSVAISADTSPAH